VITGLRAASGTFSGHHVGQPGDNDVKASWNNVGDHYEGKCREMDGEDSRLCVLQFTFKL
jgi:hypothetical protein